MYFRPIRLFKLFLLFLCIILVLVEFYRLLTRIQKTRPIVSSLISVQFTGDIEEFSHQLEPFYIALPNFSDEEAKNWFYSSSYYKYHSKKCLDGICEGKGVLFNDTKEHLSVHVFLVTNGLYLNDDCGYNYGVEASRRVFKNSEQTTVIYEKAILYPVPDGWSFQHFLDGIGPKLAHSRAYLQKYPDAKVIILQGIRFDRSVKEIWSMLGEFLSNGKKRIKIYFTGVEESERIIHYTANMKLGARLLINPCRTPGIHPRLWQDARQMYWSISGVLNSSKEVTKRNFIYIQRTSSNAMNGARLILNEEPFIKILQDYATKHSLNYVQYDHSKDTGHIRNRIELFHDAKVIIGVHSGALSNMNFAPSDTTVIEIMPYRSESSSLPMTCSMFQPEDIKACAGYILYTQARLLNQSYWILPTVVNPEGNLNVDMNRVQKLMDQI